MKVTTPEISWHGRDPVYSIDFQRLNGDIRRIATCGADRFVRLWEVKVSKSGEGGVEFLASLSRHTRAVNVVRFSPDGEVLASAGDDFAIMLWRRNDMPASNNIFAGDEDEENKENWSVFKVLRSHLEDVYDLSWSHDGKFLISGSVDNSAILWDVKKGSRVGIFPDHKSLVQGVAYDPRGEFLATLSCDRNCRIFSQATKNCLHSMSKLTLPNVNMADGKPRPFRMFHDDTMRSFFRRLTFTPDGSLLIVPSGCIEQAGESTINTTFVYRRGSFAKPVLHLPGPKKATLVASCSPILYELRKVPRLNNKIDASTEEDKENDTRKEWEKYETLFALPYRMIFAVASEDSIFLYDTQQVAPFAFISNIHYHQISDLSWSPDGLFLVVSSTDGYCTFVTFTPGELGSPYKTQVVKTKTKEEVAEERQADVRQKKMKKKHKKGHAMETDKKTTLLEEKKLTENMQTEASSTPEPLSPKHSTENQEVTPVVSTPSSKETNRILLTPKSASDRSTPKRRVTVETLSVSDSPSSAASTGQTTPSVTNIMSTPTSSKSARRIQVTTIETNDKKFEAADATPMEEDTEESSLNLVLEETSDMTEVKEQLSSTETHPPTPSSSQNKDSSSSNTDKKKAKRRVTVTTLTTLS